jgi:hypothetical protein
VLFRKTIALLEGSYVSSTCPSEKSNTKIKMSMENGLKDNKEKPKY